MPSSTHHPAPPRDILSTVPPNWSVQRVAIAGDVAYVGTVNGGVWKTENIRAQVGGKLSPHWYPSTDATNATCSSIGALAIDPGNSLRVVAGCGNPSNYGSYQSMTAGVMLTLDGGATWQMTNFGVQSAMAGVVDTAGGRALQMTVTDVVLQANDCMVVSTRYEYLGNTLISSNGCTSTCNVGIWRSCDNGATWSKTLSDKLGGFFSMSADPTDATFLIATHRDGVYKSTDSGATWSLTSTATTDFAAVVQLATNGVSSISHVGSVLALWAGYYTDDGSDKYRIYRSIDAGATWTSLTEPGSVGADGALVGLGNQVCESLVCRSLIPFFHDQAFLHVSFCLVLSSYVQGNPNFCMLADPDHTDIVYVGGTGILGSEPGNVGNINQVGRMFRGLASGSTETPAGQWSPLSSNGTTSNSGVHTDLRHFAWDAVSGNLLNTNDGGVYWRTTPRTDAGDWATLNGDLAIQEALSADYDPATGMVAVGAQDNSCCLTQPSNDVFLAGRGLPAKGVPGGDGGYVNINSAAGLIQTTSQQLGMGLSTISTYANTAPLSSESAYVYSFDLGALPQFSGGEISPFQPYLAPNAVNPARLLACTSAPAAGCFDITTNYPAAGAATTVVSKSPLFLEAYTYGGYRNGVADANVLIGVAPGGVFAFKSGSAVPTSLSTPAGSTTWAVPFSILSANPTNFHEALFGCRRSGQGSHASDVWLTADFGATWTAITGNILEASGAAFDFLPQSSLIMNLASGARAYLVRIWQGLDIKLDNSVESIGSGGYMYAFWHISPQFVSAHIPSYTSPNHRHRSVPLAASLCRCPRPTLCGGVSAPRPSSRSSMSCRCAGTRRPRLAPICSSCLRWAAASIQC